MEFAQIQSMDVAFSGCKAPSHASSDRIIYLNQDGEGMARLASVHWMHMITFIIISNYEKIILKFYPLWWLNLVVSNVRAQNNFKPRTTPIKVYKMLSQREYQFC